MTTRSHSALFLSTEMGTVTETLPKEMNKEWEWFRFSSAIKPHFVPDGHGAYELVVEVRHCSYTKPGPPSDWLFTTRSLRRRIGPPSITPKSETLIATRRVTLSSRIPLFRVTGKCTDVQMINSCTTREKRFISITASPQSFDFSDSGWLFSHHPILDKPSSLG